MEVSGPFIATKQLSVMYSNICLYSSLASLLFILFPKYLNVCSATVVLLCAIYCGNTLWERSLNPCLPAAHDRSFPSNHFWVLVSGNSLISKYLYHLQAIKRMLLFDMLHLPNTHCFPYRNLFFSDSFYQKIYFFSSKGQ